MAEFYRRNSRVFKIIFSYRKKINRFLGAYVRNYDFLRKKLDILTTEKGEMICKRYNHFCKIKGTYSGYDFALILSINTFFGGRHPSPLRLKYQEKF